MIQKSAILPVVTTLLLAGQAIFHVQFPDGLAEQVADTIVMLGSLYVTIRHGIFKNHVTEKKDPSQ